MRKSTVFSVQCSVLLAVACVALGGAGCASFETNAYRTLGTTVGTVDLAMNVWGDYVRAGKADAVQEARVREVYGHYQDAARLLQSALAAIKTQPEGAKFPEAALRLLQATSGDLLTLIRNFLPPERAALLKGAS